MVIGFDVRDGRFFTTVYSLGSGLLLWTTGNILHIGEYRNMLHIGEYSDLSRLAMFVVRPSVFRQCIISSVHKVLSLLSLLSPMWPVQCV